MLYNEKQEKKMAERFDTELEELGIRLSEEQKKQFRSPRNRKSSSEDIMKSL